MRNEHAKWIADWAARHNNVGAGKRIAKLMCEVFPELRAQRGTVTVMDGYEVVEHHWCVDGDEVVDPTANQFPGLVPGSYRPVVERERFEVCTCRFCNEPLTATNDLDAYEVGTYGFCNGHCETQYEAAMAPMRDGDPEDRYFPW